MKKSKIDASRFWKCTAIIFIILFVVIVILGIIRANQFRPEYSAVQPQQIELAKKSIAQDLSSRGDDINNYTLHTPDMTRKFAKDHLSKNIIQIVLSKGSTTQHYLVDAESGKILMRSETVVYEWMQDAPMAPQYKPMFHE